MEGNSGAQDLENRVRRQVDQILSEIRGTAPAARRPGESISFEDVAAATARAVIPAILVDLPLEMERVIRRAPDGVGETSEERVELLRLIISRLSAEWSDLAKRLVGRLEGAVASSGDAASVRSLREETARRFRAARPWAVLLGGPDAAPEDGRRKAAPPVAVAEELAEKIADAVARRVEAGRAQYPAPAPPTDLAERVAEATANHLKTGVIGDLRRDLAEIQDVGARTEAMRAVLRGELERALGTMAQSAFRPDEVRMIAAHIAHTLGGTLTNWIFGPPRPEEPRRIPRGASRKAARAPRVSRGKAAPKRRSRKGAKARPKRARRPKAAAKAVRRKPKARRVAKRGVRKPAPKPKARKAARKPKARRVAKRGVRKPAPKPKVRKAARPKPRRKALARAAR